MKPEELPFRLEVTAFFDEKGSVKKLGHSIKGPTISTHNRMYEIIDGAPQLTDQGLAFSMEITASLFAGICKQAVKQNWGGVRDPHDIKQTMYIMIEEMIKKPSETFVEKVKRNNEN